MTKPLRVGVIGLGKLGLLHAGIFQALTGSCLVSIVDRDRTIVDVLTNGNPEIRGYTDYRKLLKDGDVDAVVISTPTQSHVPIALDCVKANTPFLLEKPLCRTSAEGSHLREALLSDPVINMCGYMTRFQPSFLKGHALLKTKALGRLQLMRASMYVAQLFDAGKGWRYDPAISGGGVLMTQNCHLIDLLLWYFGEVDCLNAHTTQLYSKAVEDHAHVMLNFRSGLSGYLDASWSVRGFRTPTISIFVQGTKGQMTVTDNDVTVSLDQPSVDLDAGEHIWRPPDLYQAVPYDIGGAHYTRQAMAFISAICDQTTIDSDVHSALKVQQIIDAAYASAGDHSSLQNPMMF